MKILTQVMFVGNAYKKELKMTTSMKTLSIIQHLTVLEYTTIEPPT